MDILDIAIAKQLAGGGGGSGTDNYNDLSNLPKINDVTLSGNKSSSALGLQSEITSENKLDSDLIDDTDQDNKFVTSSEKNIWNAKQNAIDADHKLNADYVDDSTSTNKFVTASDKEAWNAKQNAIDNSHKLSSDLVDDANHTNKFVTSTEKNTWNGKQNAIDSEHKLSSSLVSFTTSEAAALASGIDSAKVAQISTNQSNILYVAENGVKNVFPVASGTTSHSDGTLFDKIALHLIAGSWNFSWTSTATPIAGTIMAYDSNKTEITRIAVPSGSTAFSGTLTLSQDAYYVTLYVGIDTTVSNIMCKPSWMSNDYQPFSLPNYDLTRLEAEDRASLAEVVDSGAKNIANIPSTQTIAGITFTCDSNGYITSSASNDSRAWNAANRNVSFSVPKGKYIVYAEAPSSNTGNVSAYVFENDGPNYDLALTPGSSRYVEINATSAMNIGIEYKPLANKVRYMICTKAAFGVSQKFVPYRPNYDAVSKAAMSAAFTHQTIQNADLNSINKNYYGLYQSAANMPSGTSGFAFVRTTWFDSQAAMQELTLLAATSNSYVRVKYGNAWTAWKQVTNA